MTYPIPKPVLPAAALSLALAACGKADMPAPVAAPVEVAVLTLRPQPVAVTTELAGRATASLTAEVRPQVGGIIEKRVFREGSDVKAGDALYLIARNGQLHRIPRQSVRGIDHPGNVEVLVGAILLGLGAFTASEEWKKNDHDDAALVTAVYGIPGLTLLLTGLFRYIPSRKAAWAFQSADAPPAPPPPPGVWYPPPPPMLQQPPAPPQPPGPSAPLPVEPAPPPAEPPGPEVMPDAT